MPLPEEFLKRWLEFDQEEEAKKLIENFGAFLENMRWTMIKDKLFKRYEIQWNEEEIRDLAHYRVASYFGGYQYGDLVDKMVERILQDDQQVSMIVSDILSSKLFRTLKDVMKVVEKEITHENLENKMKELKKQTGADSALAEVEVPEEEE
jgi:trigger factor